MKIHAVNVIIIWDSKCMSLLVKHVGGLMSAILDYVVNVFVLFFNLYSNGFLVGSAD